MKQDIKKRWIAALRSGEYKQTKQMLNDGKGMCCLGVLCDLYGKENGVVWEFKVPYTHTAVERGHMFNNSVCVPPLVADWAGLRTGNPELPFKMLDEDEPPETANIAALNDEANLNFSQIADVIEAML